jgi:hypothetical protein
LEQSDGFFIQCESNSKDNFELLVESCTSEGINCNTFASQIYALDLTACGNELSDDALYCEENFPE